MKAVALALCFAGLARGFVPASVSQARTSAPQARPDYESDPNALYFFGDASTYSPGAVKEMEGISKPLGYFDPFNLGDVDGVTLAWYRHAEIKHGRVAMAGFVGFLVHYNHITFSGMLSPSAGLKFSDLKGSPLEIWDATPLYGKYQILALIGLLEVCSETKKPHYLRGGKPGVIEIGGMPLAPGAAKGLEKASEESKAQKRLAEINNGRLAMVGMMGMVAASTTEGSVPALKGLYVPGYSGGLPWAPFAADFHVFGTAAAAAAPAAAAAAP